MKQGYFPMLKSLEKKTHVGKYSVRSRLICTTNSNGILINTKCITDFPCCLHIIKYGLLFSHYVATFVAKLSSF